MKKELTCNTLAWIGLLSLVGSSPASGQSPTQKSSDQIILPAPRPGPPPPPLPWTVPARPIGNPGDWVTASDYPVQALREKVSGTTSFQLAVGTDGKVAECRVTRSSGSQDLDDTTCRIVAARAQFSPALDAKGTPVAGSYSTRIRWILPVDAVQLAQPDLANVAVPQGNPALWVTELDYPAKSRRKREEGVTTFQLTINAMGRVSVCKILNSSGSSTLDAATCILVMRRAVFRPARDSLGKPITGTYTTQVKWGLPVSR